MMMNPVTLPVLRIKRSAFKRLRTGHPWIFSNELIRFPKDLDPGQLVDIKDTSDRFIGRGYFNYRSLISVRLLTRENIFIDEEFIKARIKSAMTFREQVMPNESAYRIIFGESDGLPGLIVDRYGEVLVIQVQTAGMEKLIAMIVPVLIDQFKPKSIVARNDTPSRGLEGLDQEKRLLYGESPSALVITKGGLSFEVDVWEGQKTGFFLDQANNYQCLEVWAKGARVLDAFCYTGAFSLYAAHYGAAEVLGIDSSDKAVSLAQTNARLNRVESVCTFRREEVFSALRRLHADGSKFDLIILDPPTFARSRKEVKDALRGYKEINRLAMSLLPQGGILVTCSCSHLIDAVAFRDLLGQAASDAGKAFLIKDWRTQGPDHPIDLAIPETEYLKCVVLQVK